MSETESGAGASGAAIPPGAGTGGYGLPFTVWTATRGYRWSSVPAGCTKEALAFFLEQAQAFRTAYDPPGQTLEGCIVWGEVAAAVFRQFQAEAWDYAGRDADYWALALLPVKALSQVDVPALLDNPLFQRPLREVPEVVECPARTAPATPPAELRALAARLFRGERLKDFDFTVMADLVEAYKSDCPGWRFIQIDAPTGRRMVAETRAWLRDPCPPPLPPLVPEPSVPPPLVEPPPPPLRSPEEVPEAPGARLARRSITIKRSDLVSRVPAADPVVQRGEPSERKMLFGLDREALIWGFLIGLLLGLVLGIRSATVWFARMQGGV